MFKNFDMNMVKYYFNHFSISEARTMAEMDLYYSSWNSNPGKLAIWFEVLKVEVYDLIALILCNSIGHDFQDDSPSNAGESGAFAFSCSRCGFGESGYMGG